MSEVLVLFAEHPLVPPHTSGSEGRQAGGKLSGDHTEFRSSLWLGDWRRSSHNSFSTKVKPLTGSFQKLWTGTKGLEPEKNSSIPRATAAGHRLLVTLSNPKPNAEDSIAPSRLRRFPPMRVPIILLATAI
jgi:hypothetical protein